MASSSTEHVILLSILPKYADAIMAGQKTVEFRKNGIGKGVRHVVVYASAPQKKVVGYFEVSRVERASPSALWKRYKTSGGIDEDAFLKYYSGHKHGACFLIRRVWKLKRSMTIEHLHLNLCAPQSFCYLDSKAWNQLKRRQAKRIQTNLRMI